jgi:hypothetical protein
MTIRTRSLRLCAGLAVTLLAAAPSLAQSVGPEFSYQGRIETNGSAPTGSYEMEFRLFDAMAGGTQIGPTRGFGGVQVVDGLFNLPLNFGDEPIKSGQQRWIEIRVRQTGDPAYVTLSPRQKLMAAPMATVSRFPWTPSADGTAATFTGSFVGVNRSVAVSGSEVFGLQTNFGGTNYGGMYIRTDSADGKPFYGYSANNDLIGWTYLDGAANAWRVYLGGDRLSVTAQGDVGIGTTTPGARLDVAGNLHISGSGDLRLEGGGDIVAPSGLLTERFGSFRNEFERVSSAGTFSFSSSNVVLGNFDYTLVGQTFQGKLVGDGAVGGFIGGGGSVRSIAGQSAVSLHRVYDNFGTIAGGSGNTAGDADGDPFGQAYATVSGGSDNSAVGAYSTVPGGQSNVANGDFAFAAGRRAVANGNGMFVLSDSNDFSFGALGSNAFFARFTNGYFLYTGINASGTPTTGVRVTAGSGSWTSLSDADAKHAFEPVDPAEVLAKVAAMPVQRWSYKSQDASVRHIGPTAQDFHAAFGVGDDPKGITTVDADGVALVAIQGLHAKVEHQAATIEAQRALIQAQQEAIESLTRRLEAVERAGD